MIRFLNLDAKLLHGALRKSSIFVTKAGEFKLGGLELLSPFSDLSFVEVFFFMYCVFMRRKSNGNALTTDLVLLPPELSQNGCKSLKRCFFSCICGVFILGKVWLILKRWIPGCLLVWCMSCIMDQWLQMPPH